MTWGNRELRSGHGTNAHEDEAFPDTAPCLIRTIPSRSMVLESTIGKCMAKSLSTKVAVEPTRPTIPTIRLPRTAECLGLLWCGKVFRCFYTGRGFVGFLMFLGLTIRNASIIWSLRMMWLPSLRFLESAFRFLLYSIEILMRGPCPPNNSRRTDPLHVEGFTKLTPVLLECWWILIVGSGKLYPALKASIPTTVLRKAASLTIEAADRCNKPLGIPLADGNGRVPHGATT